MTLNNQHGLGFLSNMHARLLLPLFCRFFGNLPLWGRFGGFFATQVEVAVRLFFMEFRVQGLVDLLFVLAAGVVEAVDSARE